MRDRFSTAVYCDFCGRGKNEVADLVASPTAHICDGCAELALSIVTARKATGPKIEVGCISPIDAPIDYAVEAAHLQQSIATHEGDAAQLITGTLRAIAMLATRLDRRDRQGGFNGR